MIVAALGGLLFLVAFGSLGLKILGMSDADWDDPRRLGTPPGAGEPAGEPPSGAPSSTA